MGKSVRQRAVRLRKAQLVNNYGAAVNDTRKSLKILGISALVGIGAGIVTVFYRFLLTYAEEYSFKLYSFAGENLYFIPILFIGLALIGVILGTLTAKFKMIGGSGIPQVKGIIMGYFRDNWLSTVLAKFCGGVLAVFGGLSLGREGPSIQLGAGIGQAIGCKLGQSRNERRIYIASGASAGLAAAFNAPLAGVVFCLEEIYKYFSPIILLSTMISAVASDFISRLIFGNQSVFSFNITEKISLDKYWALIILGIMLGLFGALYNFLTIKAQAVSKKITALGGRLRIIIPLLLAGGLGLIFPVVLGGGHSIIELLESPSAVSAGGTLTVGAFSANGQISMIVLLFAVFAVKLLFSVISFSSGAPGGIFFPLLTIGAAFGAVFAKSFFIFTGMSESLYYSVIVVSMAGFFTAIVRAPITGIILLVEMTGSFEQLLPLTVVSLAAYVSADLAKSKPIYDSLLENMLEGRGKGLAHGVSEEKITLERIVQIGSKADKRLVKELVFPKGCLLIAVKRGEGEIIPNGSTKLMAGDYLVCMCDLSAETRVRDEISLITDEGKT